MISSAVNLFLLENKMIVFLGDGRELAVPLEWFPRLRKVSIEQLKNRQFMGNGKGTHWRIMDANVSIGILLK